MTSAESQPRWLEIAVEVAGIDAEIAADIFRQACPGGAAIQSATRFDAASDAYIVDGDATAIVRGYLQDNGEAGRIRDSVRLALRMAPLQTAPRWRRVRRLKESDWRESWKKHFGVQRIGRAMVVKPSWTKYRPKAGEIVIEIDPGMAFGTGQHPTTAMCLRALEELVRPGMRVLDLGCGSGILGIAAAKLGAHGYWRSTSTQTPSGRRARTPRRTARAAIDVREGTLETVDSELRHHRREHQRAHSRTARARTGPKTGPRRNTRHEWLPRRRRRRALRQAYEAAGLTTSRWSRTASGGRSSLDAMDVRLLLVPCSRFLDLTP